MAQEAYSGFVQGLLEVHRRLVELHGSFAHLIKVEQEKEECKIAFFSADRMIPDTIFIFEERRCFIFRCSHGEQGLQHKNIVEGTTDLTNCILATAQHPEFGKSPQIAGFMMNLHSRLLKACLNDSCIHS